MALGEKIELAELLGIAGIVGVVVYLVYRVIQDVNASGGLGAAASNIWLSGAQDSSGNPIGIGPTIGNWLDSILGTCLATEGGLCKDNSGGASDSSGSDLYSGVTP